MQTLRSQPVLSMAIPVFLSMMDVNGHDIALGQTDKGFCLINMGKKGEPMSLVSYIQVRKGTGCTMEKREDGTQGLLFVKKSGKEIGFAPLDPEGNGLANKPLPFLTITGDASKDGEAQEVVIN